MTTNTLGLIPEKFRAVPYYADYVAAVEDLISENIWDPIDQLRDIRQPRTAERFYLALTASMLGFKFNSNLWGAGSDAYLRIVEGVSAYYSAKGTREFVDFMGWINDQQFTLVALWTRDYVHFFQLPGGPTAYADPPGPWYLTPHIALQYDAETGPVFADVENLFYYMAPVNLVLQYVSKVYNHGGSFRLLMSGLIKIVYT